MQRGESNIARRSFRRPRVAAHPPCAHVFAIDCQFDWPAAPFPKLRYPLSDHAAANRAEEDRCLARVEELIKTFRVPVAGVVVEPVQAEGGDNTATPYFFQQLRAITKRLGVSLIVDEVQTGGGPTGKVSA